MKTNWCFKEKGQNVTLSWYFILDYNSGHSINQLYEMFLNSSEGVPIYAGQLLAAFLTQSSPTQPLKLVCKEIVVEFILLLKYTLSAS